MASMEKYLLFLLSASRINSHSQGAVIYQLMCDFVGMFLFVCNGILCVCVLGLETFLG